jgi:hypothetical protein
VFSKEQDFLTATQFVFSNEAEIILFRTRMAAALLTLLLGALVFTVAKEVFGNVPAFLAVALCLNRTFLAGLSKGAGSGADRASRVPERLAGAEEGRPRSPLDIPTKFRDDR